MKSFKDYVESHGYEKMPEGNIPSIWFKRNFLPMVVKCTCCEMTMASPSAWVDDNGYTYCGDCAGVSES